MKRTISTDNRLTLIARVDGLPRMPFRNPAEWSGARLEVSESLEGLLTLWKNGLSSQADVSDADLRRIV